MFSFIAIRIRTLPQTTSQQRHSQFETERRSQLENLKFTPDNILILHTVQYVDSSAYLFGKAY